jgi:transcriptional regulator with XRE-family HTH domain
VVIASSTRGSAAPEADTPPCSQDALAAKLGIDRTVVAKAETGQRPPTVDVLAAWCQACHLDDELFGRLAVLARRADGPVPTWFEDWLRAEGEAHELRVWQPLIIPGLLQTAGTRGRCSSRPVLMTRRLMSWSRYGWTASRYSTAPNRRM